jgi:hypothetical protein
MTTLSVCHPDTKVLLFSVRPQDLIFAGSLCFKSLTLMYKIQHLYTVSVSTCRPRHMRIWGRSNERNTCMMPTPNRSNLQVVLTLPVLLPIHRSSVRHRSRNHSQPPKILHHSHHNLPVFHQQGPKVHEGRIIHLTTGPGHSILVVGLSRLVQDTVRTFLDRMHSIMLILTHQHLLLQLTLEDILLGLLRHLLQVMLRTLLVPVGRCQLQLVLTTMHQYRRTATRMNHLFLDIV